MVEPGKENNEDDNNEDDREASRSVGRRMPASGRTMEDYCLNR